MEGHIQMNRISVIICSYNPPIQPLLRVINSIQNQKLEGISIEKIIVDNNSSNQFLEDTNLKSSLNTNGWKIVQEPKAGLSYARIAGVNHSTNDFILFVDDDNVLNENYVQNLIRHYNEHPQAGIIGAGKIDVEFTGGGDEYIKKHFKKVFQYREFSTYLSGNAVWENFYPPGSGISIRKKVFNVFAENFIHGKISLTGRKAESLSSGEDAQMIWTTLQLGFTVDTAPDLSLIHLIPEKRCSLSYIIQLNQSIAYSFYKGQAEFYPDLAAGKKAGLLYFWKRRIQLWMKYPFQFKRIRYEFAYEQAWHKGHVQFVDKQ